MIVFNKESEYKSSAITLVSRLVFDNAVEIVSSGNVADESEIVLAYLLSLAKQQSADKKSIDAIAFYNRQILDENQEMLRYR